MNDELERLDGVFRKRKQLIREASDAFMTTMKKLCEDKPVLTDERYETILKEHQEFLLKNYEAYKKREETNRLRLGK